MRFPPRRSFDHAVQLRQMPQVMALAVRLDILQGAGYRQQLFPNPFHPHQGLQLPGHLVPNRGLNLDWDSFQRGAAFQNADGQHSPHILPCLSVRSAQKSRDVAEPQAEQRSAQGHAPGLPRHAASCRKPGSSGISIPIRIRPIRFGPGVLLAPAPLLFRVEGVSTVAEPPVFPPFPLFPVVQPRGSAPACLAVALQALHDQLFVGLHTRCPSSLAV